MDQQKPLLGKRVAFVGRLGGLNRREVFQLVRDHEGIPVEKAGPSVDLVVIGADCLPSNSPEEQLPESVRTAADEGRLEVITETQLWQRLGLVDIEQNIRRLYTPAMLADLLEIPIAIIRRWGRRGLIKPAKVVHRLPYYDFQEVATARRLADLLASGMTPAAIEKKLEQLARFVPDVERPLAQLTTIIEGKEILLRQGEGLVEPGGQMRFDFDAWEEDARSQEEDAPAVILSPHEEATVDPAEADEEDTVVAPTPPSMPFPDSILNHAAELEEAGMLDEAVDAYHAALAAGGPNAETCFMLAELLYRTGDAAGARERYYMTIELDENHVEGRANLGCVLAESNQHELAVAAFEGALKYHPDYPDVHYHLARTLDEIGRGEEANTHWQKFLTLAPDNPWAEEAHDRLEP